MELERKLRLEVGSKCTFLPHRVQLPGTACVFYALGMLMDFWYMKSPHNKTALVCQKDRTLKKLDPHRYLFNPNCDGRFAICQQLFLFFIGVA